MIIEIGLPPLNENDLEMLCDLGDNKIKKFIFSKIAKSKVDILESTIEINNDNNICNIDIELDLEIPSLSSIEVNKIAEDAIKMAFEAIENKLKEIKNDI